MIASLKPSLVVDGNAMMPTAKETCVEVERSTGCGQVAQPGARSMRDLEDVPTRNNGTEISTMDVEAAAGD